MSALNVVPEPQLTDGTTTRGIELDMEKKQALKEARAAAIASAKLPGAVNLGMRPGSGQGKVLGSSKRSSWTPRFLTPREPELLTIQAFLIFGEHTLMDLVGHGLKMDYAEQKVTGFYAGGTAEKWKLFKEGDVITKIDGVRYDGRNLKEYLKKDGPRVFECEVKRWVKEPLTARFPLTARSAAAAAEPRFKCVADVEEAIKQNELQAKQLAELQAMASLYGPGPLPASLQPGGGSGVGVGQIAAGVEAAFARGGLVGMGSFTSRPGYGGGYGGGF